MCVSVIGQKEQKASPCNKSHCVETHDLLSVMISLLFLIVEELITCKWVWITIRKGAEHVRTWLW